MIGENNPNSDHIDIICTFISPPFLSVLVLTLVGIQQFDLDVVVVAEHVIRNLEAWGDPSSTGNHDELVALFCHLGPSDGFDPVISTIAKIFHVSLGSLNVDRVADFEGIQVLAQLSSVREFGMDAGPVDLDDENDFSEGRVVAHRSVRSHDLHLFTGLRVGFEITKRNVLTGGQTEDGFRSWESKDKFSRVVRQHRLSNERKWLEVGHW